jgi:hypothetical protein
MSEIETREVKNLLTEAMIEKLRADLMGEELEVSAGLIRYGRLQDDPTIAGINLLLHNGGKDFPDEPHANVQGSKFRAPTYQLGGGTTWWRRFRIEIEIFVETSDRDDARVRANIIVARIHRSLEDMMFPATDDFGESAMFLQFGPTHLNEQGGDGMFIHRGEARVEILTAKEG